MSISLEASWIRTSNMLTIKDKIWQAILLVCLPSEMFSARLRNYTLAKSKQALVLKTKALALYDFASKKQPLHSLIVI